jgi:hypothetical protein
MDLHLNGQRADDLVVKLAQQGIAVVVVSGYDITQPVADSAFATFTKPVASAALLGTLYRAVNSFSQSRAGAS